mmetsp:Transcript_11128/g.33196  ORF Transcript_11128/g.33196 Transcript_11128/m.33196 type:complete len:291 (-) Transcript_11128:25-897(-)
MRALAVLVAASGVLAFSPSVRAPRAAGAPARPLAPFGLASDRWRHTSCFAAADDDDAADVEVVDEAEEAAEEVEEEAEEAEEAEAEEDPNAEVKARIAALEAKLKEKRLELSRKNGAAAEASEAGYRRIVADVATYKKNAAETQRSVAEVAKADAFKSFDKVLLEFAAAREAAPAGDDEAAQKVHDSFAVVEQGLYEQFALMGMEPLEAKAGDAYEPWLHEQVSSEPGEGDSNTVLELVAPGYRLASTGAVIRKAQVAVQLAKVVEEPAEEPEESEAEAEESADEEKPEV